MYQPWHSALYQSQSSPPERLPQVLAGMEKVIRNQVDKTKNKTVVMWVTELVRM